MVEELRLRYEIIDAGLSYEVGVAGARLSSSQRQKLGLARSLIKQPDLLIVNEALAGLDTAAERRIIARAREQMQSRGIFWVLARVKLAEMFDRVVVMERGRLVGDGEYTALLEENAQLRGLLEQE